MRVIYLFCEANVVRIPFLYYNSDLFRLIVRFDGAKCDNFRHEFYFNRDIISNLTRYISTTTSCVQIDEEHPEQLQVFGFFERPWPENQFNISAYNSKFPNKNVSNEYKGSYDSPFIFPKPPSKPEMFPEHLRIKLETELRARKYSPRTQRAYIYYNRLICRCLQKNPEDISSENVTQFLATMEKNGEYSVSAMNLAISSIKFLFKNVYNSDKINERHRPRQDERLPMVLSTDEIKRILSMEKNPKHRLLLMLAYSSGLRVSEVVALKKEHIDFSRKVIYIRQGKGRKDRSTILSEKASQFIKEYIDFFDIGVWLFPGQKSNRPLTIRSAQHIFDKSLRRAQIFKKISIHGLRHSFATHLLESGTDIRYIQSLLGHANIRTTERYTHVARRSVLKIKSPLDTIL
jgi:site-specific recombinase XerD